MQSVTSGLTNVLQHFSDFWGKARPVCWVPGESAVSESDEDRAEVQVRLPDPQASENGDRATQWATDPDRPAGQWAEVGVGSGGQDS